MDLTNLLKSLNKGHLLDVLLLLLAHHLQELIEVYSILQLVLTHRPHHLHQLRL
jgi:hypothetical protein